MQVQRVQIAPAEAMALYRASLAHAQYSTKMDDEIRRGYRMLSKGKKIIKAIESIRVTGLDEKGLPKLALARATASHCFLRRNINGSMHMSSNEDWWRERNKQQIHFPRGTFKFPAETFPLSTFQRGSRVDITDHKAITPIIPIDIRPKQALESYHILWEAEWQPMPPVDPILLRRIGDSDLWLVCGEWNLTEIERAVLATRI
jgi:hypothetical protein